MNKNGIALAADSAVTIETPKGVKIYNTAHKLFTLSKYHPIGVMIYGEKLGEKIYPRLTDYADDFIGFLSANNHLFPLAQQDNYFE